MMSVECTTNWVFNSDSIISQLLLNRLGHQFGHADKIVRSSDPPSRQSGSIGSPVVGLSKSSHGLHPTENLFYSFSYPLTDAIALMAHGTTINRRSASSLGIGCYMRDDLSASQKIHKPLSVIGFIGSHSFYPHAFSFLTLYHTLSRFPLCGASGLTDGKINQQAVAVLHQGMRRVTQLGFFARPFADQQTVGIGGGLMGVGFALLAVKVHPGITRISLIFTSRFLFAFGSKALQASPCLNESTVHRKMLCTHQSRVSGFSDHRVEEQTAHLVLHQSLAVLTEYRGIKTFFLKLHIQKPAKQKIIAQLLAKLPLASHRVECDQQQRLQDLLGRHRGPSNVGIHPIKYRRQSQELLIRHPFYPSQWMLPGNTGLDRKQRQHTCLSVLGSVHQRLRRFFRPHTNIRSDSQSRKNVQIRSFSAACEI